MTQATHGGLDDSGSYGGAGGIGGLLMWKDGQGTYEPLYDGLGNVQAVWDTTNNHIVSEYEYDPYGNLVRTTGYTLTSGTWKQVSGDPIDNPFRYQTKWSMDASLAPVTETDMYAGYQQFDIYDYGMRWYHPRYGRFINRDPIGESGGTNLNAFVGNNPVGRYDVLGMGDDTPMVYYPPQEYTYRILHYYDDFNQFRWLQEELSAISNSYIQNAINSYYRDHPNDHPQYGNGSNSGSSGGGSGNGSSNGETQQPDPKKTDKEQEQLKIDCAARARLAAEGENPTRWEGPVNYKFGAFIASYGRFEGVLVANEPAARTASISGNLFGVGVQGGYVTGQIERAVWYGNSAAEILGSNGAFFNFTVGVSAGPVDIIGYNAEIAAHRGPTNADVSSVQGAPSWPGLSTTFDPANPASYLEKPKIGLGGGGGVNGFHVTNFQITEDPCAGLK